MYLWGGNQEIQIELSVFGVPCPSAIYEGIFSKQVSKETKGEAYAENEQETETRMVAVPEPPGTALLQQLVQAMRPQL